jgi:transient receptor potential cation channel subfamily A protein 1
MYIPEGLSSTRQVLLLITSLVIIILSTIQLLLKMFQLVTLKIYYLLNWVNWLEVSLYICAIVFVSAIRVDCFCHVRSQWQVGCIAVFLAWIDLILFIEKLPYAGVLMRGRGYNSGVLKSCHSGQLFGT